MRKYALNLIFFFFLIHSQLFAKSFFWKLQDSEIYLLGSIHLADSSLYPLPPEVEEAFKSSKALVVETNPAGESASEIQQFMLGKILAPQFTLESQLNDSLKAVLDSLTKEFGLPSQAILHSEPWLAAINLTQLGLSKIGHSPTFGVDFHFLREAQAQQKQIFELENGIDQLKLFGDLSAQEQMAFFYQTLKDLKTLESEFGKLLEFWKQGNVAGLEDFLYKDLLSNPELKNFGEKLLFERNAKWVEQIKIWHQEGKKLFIVVGAAHLVGENSVLDLLGNNSIQTEPISTSN